MSTDIQQLGRKNSYRAIVSGKSLIQLGHFAANARILFDQVDLNAHVTQIQGGLHAGYPTAHDENFLRSHTNHPCPNIHELELKTLRQEIVYVTYLHSNFHVPQRTTQMQSTLGTCSY